MSTKEMEQFNAALKQVEALAKTKGGSRVKNRTYNLQTGNPSMKISPQAVTCIKVIASIGTEVKEQDLFTKFQEPEVAEMLKTKQEPWRIFQYYRKQLVDAGWIVVK